MNTPTFTTPPEGVTPQQILQHVLSTINQPGWVIIIISDDDDDDDDIDTSYIEIDMSDA